MKSDEYKLEKLKERIFSDVARSCEMVTDEKKRELSKRMDEYNAKLLLDEKSAVSEAAPRAEIKCAEKIAAAEREAVITLTSRRGKLINELKNDLTERLDLFAKTREYAEYIERKAQKARAVAGEAKITAVFLGEPCPLPQGFEARHGEGLPGGVIFEIPEKGIIIDCSFRTLIDTVIKDFHDIRI